MKPSTLAPRPSSLTGDEMPELKHEVLMQEEGIFKSSLPVVIRNKIKALNFVVRCYNRTPSQAHRNNIIKKDIEICDLVQDFIEAEAPTEEEYTKKEQEEMAKEKEKKKIALSEAEGDKEKTEAKNKAAEAEKNKQDEIAQKEAERQAAAEKKAKAKKVEVEDDEDPVDFLTGN